MNDYYSYQEDCDGARDKVGNEEEKDYPGCLHEIENSEKLDFSVTFQIEINTCYSLRLKFIFS